MTQTPRPLTDLLRGTINTIETETLTIGHFIDSLHERGFGILIFLFALPMAIPVPVPPGVNLIFSTPLLFLTFQQIYGAKKPWLPHFIRKKKITKTSLEKTITKAAPWLDRLSFFIRPRFGNMTQGRISHLIGVFGFVFALCVCIPVPMTNTVPSLAIALMAIGVLMRDGLAILIGIIIGTAWISLLLTLGISGFKALIGFIF
ncbi:MAG: exopolysaccharide biosynthesis protein exod [Alphaproteobacteria bacterium]|nr:MAG: exopolysaccharide biosynthesis protein exod [Alphaproteobacteria bacterium]